MAPPPGLTPGEELPQEARVLRQVQEFEQMQTPAHWPQRSLGDLANARQREQSAANPLDQDDDDLLSFFEYQWSGSLETFRNGTTNFQCSSDGKWSLLAKRNDEIDLKDLSKTEREMFDKADLLEWQAILDTKAVSVVTGKEAERLRRLYPHRILSSRMVRRKKPQPGIGAWKAKSRWCLRGHADPDSGSLVTYAPTPQGEGLMTFLQTALNLNMEIAFGDIKNAFCQSKPLSRASGPLFSEPCPGLQLEPGSLIIINIPVYGLDDAPASWRATVTDYLVRDLQFERNIVEPCWFTKFDKKTGEPLAQLLVEVDDFIIAAVPSYSSSLKNQLTTRFNFGKWEDREAEYAGRFIRTSSSRIEIDQSKYIMEQIFPVHLQKGRRSTREALLSQDEFEGLRSLVYKINWVAKETRREVSGTASIMASRLGHATIQDVITVNEVVNFRRSTAQRPLTLWKFSPSEMCFTVFSDAGGINTKHQEEDEHGLPTDSTQGAWMVVACARLPEGSQPVKASPIAWRSSKLKRKVFSTFGGETQAMLQGVNEVDWIQIMYRDATKHDIMLKSWRNSLSPHMLVVGSDCTLPERQPQCSVTDAKSLFDCLLKEHPSGKQDRKSSLELAIVLRDLQETRSMIRWIPHQKMIVDCMTKTSLKKGNGALLQFLKSGWLSLVDVDRELQNRKDDVAYRRRSNKASSERLQKEYADSLQAFCLGALSTLSRGNCEISAVTTT